MTKIIWFIVLLFTLVGFVLVLFTAASNAGPPILVDPQTGKYLGTLSSNPNDQDSVGNPDGQ